MKRFVVFLCIVVAVSATDYCSPSLCRKDKKHIACGHNGRFNESCPADAKMVTITNDVKKYIVDAHNAKRNIIAGGGDYRYRPACRMATMKWDNELASLAALNVKQCSMEHDECHNTNEFRHSGQNLAWSGYFGTLNPINEIDRVIEDWYSEKDYCQQALIDHFPRYYSGPAIKHFTGMMVDRNIRVGCAASTYTNPSDDYKTFLIACNYASVTMGDRSVYASCNNAGEGCTSGRNKKYRNLCSDAERYDVNNWF